MHPGPGVRKCSCTLRDCALESPLPPLEGGMQQHGKGWVYSVQLRALNYLGIDLKFFKLFYAEQQPEVKHVKDQIQICLF